MIDGKPLPIRFNKLERLIRVYGRTRYLVLFVPEKNKAIYNRITYLISQKSGIRYVISHNYAVIKTDSHYSLPVEKY